jgi:hypothetical protein
MSAVKRAAVGTVAFNKITARKPLIDQPLGDKGPQTYSDRAVLGVDNKLALKRNSHLGQWCNMDKLSPRDNKMYLISDTNNLEGKRLNAMDRLV